MKIGILGGGQLARMLALAAYPLDIQLIGVDPKSDCCATPVTQIVHTNFFNLDEIAKYLQNIDCLTYETENLPIESVNLLAKHYKMQPSLEALRITQDRGYEKKFLNDLQIPTADYAELHNWDDLQQFINKFDFPAILKTRRSGYDGKGQYKLNHWEDAKKAWKDAGDRSLIIEKLVNFDFEVSIIAVRNYSGEIAFYPLIKNYHRKGILLTSQAPFVNANLQSLAEKYALTVLERFNYIGVLTIEFFVQGNQLIANEIAPRVHNSGHWTIEGAETSQFENHLRAIAGYPLGSTKTRSYCVMINLLGENVRNLPELLKIPGLHYHWYGKKPEPSRKLGHITLCANDEKQLAENVDKALKQTHGTITIPFL